MPPSPATSDHAARPESGVLRKLLFSVTALVLLFGGAELVTRLVHGWNRHWVEMHRYHPVLGWCLREGWSGRSSWGGGYSHVNDEGIRADGPALPKPSGEKRLLALGDSVTFGALVRTRDAWPAQVDERLKDSIGWRVLNGGVTSYDPSQEADWLEHFGWRLQPDALAVAFCRNDVCTSTRSPQLAREPVGAGLRWLTEHSILAYRLQQAVWHLQARTDPSAVNMASAASETPEVAVGGWPQVEQSYRRIAAAARARGLPVVLIIFPTLDLLEGREHDDLSERLTQLGHELGWTVIDLAEAFQDGPANLFAPNDPVHPNAEGYHRAAAHIARALEQNGVLR